MNDSDPKARRHLKNGTVLQRARLAKGMTLGDVSAACLAQGCRVDPRNLSRAEQNLGGIGARKLPVLMAVLELTPEDLVPDVRNAA